MNIFTGICSVSSNGGSAVPEPLKNDACSLSKKFCAVLKDGNSCIEDEFMKQDSDDLDKEKNKLFMCLLEKRTQIRLGEMFLYLEKRN